MFARIVKHFGFDHDRLLNMPVKRFWFYNKQVDRLAAEEDLRMASLLAAVTSSEGYKEALDRLQKQMGEICVIAPAGNRLVVSGEDEPEFDRAAFHALKLRIKNAGR